MTFDFKKEFFDTIATFVQTIAGWIIPASKNIAQISNGISNPVVAADKNIDLRWLSGGCGNTCSVYRDKDCRGICCNQVVYERLAGYKELLLKLQTDRLNI